MTVNQRIEMIQALCDAHGVSGFEDDVRKLYTTYLEPLSDEIIRDRFGGVVGKKTGDANGPKVLLAGHLDEIGFMVTHISDEGYLKFRPLGGWSSLVVLAQRVVIHTRKGPLVGVIGSTPPHILPADERKKAPELKDMFIDIGAKDKAEAEAAGVRLGDAVTPDSRFTGTVNKKVFMAKAIDNRLGCATAVEVLRELQGQSHPNVLYAGASAQEEVGLRGARTLVNAIQPDIAFALDVGIAGDTPGITSTDALSKLGSGPIVVILDASIVPNPRLRDFVMDTASDAGIPAQLEISPGGGTDAGWFQFQGSGVPSLAFGVPTRYIHSHSGLYHQDDFDNGVRLLAEVVKRLDATTAKTIIEG